MLRNECLLLGSLFFSLSAVLVAWRMFGKSGLYAMTIFCTITANIEALLLVHAFGMDQTLGNTLFAASFLITDILSENEGKKAADRAVSLGIFISIVFILVSQSWLHYQPVEEDALVTSVHTVFSNTPRLMIASIAVYAITQRLDVWLYHTIWKLTNKKSGNSRKYLWIRNNGSTLTSQFFNSLLFTFGAFLGTYPLRTLFSIFASSYVIFIVTSLCDTPFAYLARRWRKKDS